jgi:hypothetical protein
MPKKGTSASAAVDVSEDAAFEDPDRDDDNVLCGRG